MKAQYQLQCCLCAIAAGLEPVQEKEILCSLSFLNPALLHIQYIELAVISSNLLIATDCDDLFISSEIFWKSTKYSS